MDKEKPKTAKRRATAKKKAGAPAAAIAPKKKQVYPSKGGLKVKVKLSVLEEILKPASWNQLAWNKADDTLTLNLSAFFVKFDPKDFGAAITEPDGGGCLTFYFEK